tara:strand:+ start:6689 stop:7426 length:738 start_codon:yes stop_codon:yes gene_type:complete
MEPSLTDEVNNGCGRKSTLPVNCCKKNTLVSFAPKRNAAYIAVQLELSIANRGRTGVRNSVLKLSALCSLIVLLTGCGAGTQTDYDSYPGSAPGDQRVGTEGRAATKADVKERGGLFGGDGLNIFGGEEKKEGPSSGIGVNSFLWRATLDTLSFMPLNSADPFGGVIITDWYTPPESSDERFKLTAYILGTALRSDAIKVSVFRQVNVGPNQWQDAVVEPGTVTSMEDAILTRARQLRIDSANSE